MQIALNKLSLSKLNVRKVKAISDEALAENIFANGQLQNLIGTAGEGDTAEVVAGGRRLAAMQLLAKTGRWAEDHPVNVEIVDAEKAVEISLSENAMREGMHPADQFEAFHALSKQGMSNEDIAARFGLSALVVSQRLKLAVVSKKLVKAYRAGEMNLAHLEAFTLTDDHALQEKVWGELPKWAKEQPNGASRIKAALTEGMVDAKQHTLARFVGFKALEKAGAVTTRDLFAGEDGGYLVNSAKLAEMAKEKLDGLIAKEIKAGWKFVIDATGMNWQIERGYGQIAATLTDEQQAEIEKRHERLQEIEQADDSADEAEADALYAEQEKIEAEIQQIEHEATFTDEDKARSGVLVSIGHDGKVHYSRGRLTPEDAKAEQKAARKAHGADRAGDGAPKAEGHSAALVEALTAHRTVAMAVELAKNPHVALATAVQALIGTTKPMMFVHPLAQITARVPSYNGSGEEIEQSKAGKELAKREKAVTKGMPEDGKELLGWLIEQTDKRLMDIMAVCVARSLDTRETRNGTKPDADAITTLREALDLDMAAYWQPTAENYFNRVPKRLVESAVKEACGTDGIVEISGCKKPEMDKRAEALMKGKGWLPQLMR